MKIHSRKNHRVVIIPDKPWLLSEENLGMTKENFVKIASYGEDVVSQVKRHVDGYTDVYYDCDASEICSFCGEEWEEDGDGCPICCQKAVEEWEQQCKHPKTVAINEEGRAGIFCVDCNEKLEDGC